MNKAIIDNGNYGDNVCFNQGGKSSTFLKDEDIGIGNHFVVFQRIIRNYQRIFVFIMIAGLDSLLLRTF